MQQYLKSIDWIYFDYDRREWWNAAMKESYSSHRQWNWKYVQGARNSEAYRTEAKSQSYKQFHFAKWAEDYCKIQVEVY